MYLAVARRQRGLTGTQRAPELWRGILALVALGIGPAVAAEPAPGARVDNPAGLRWRETTQEGRMPDGRSDARFGFTVENVSPEPVAVLAVHVSCPCVSFEWPPLPGRPLMLRPGGKAVLQVVLTARPGLRVQEETLVVESSLGFSVLRVKAVRTGGRREGGTPGRDSAPERTD